MILASGSPRRAEILRTLGLSFDVVSSDVDETPLEGELPRDHVERLARAKALKVAERYPERFVIGGDTIVALDDGIIGKPTGPDDAVRMLNVLSGRTHHVLSAVAVVVPRESKSLRSCVAGVELTAVTFRRFDERTAREYVSTGEPLDKAGAYGIQGMGAALVEGIEGDYSGVVGLPVPLLLRLLERVGRPYVFPSASVASTER